MTRTLSQKLNSRLEQFETITDPEERALMLIGYAEKYRGVPTDVARRPYPADHRVPFCESEAYVWMTRDNEGKVSLSIAVENPSGISAKALAVILTETLSGATAEEAASVPQDIVTDIFRENISMGKGMGLMGIVDTIRRRASELAGRSVVRGQ